MPTGLDLWNAVEATDARYTKKIEGRQFKGDTVNNVYVAKKLSAALGPVGVRWGWRVVEERLHEFGNHEQKTWQLIHWLRVEMWIKGDDGKKETFENFGVTKAGYYGRNGLVIDDEFPKKSMTDALSKLMVYLGGSADIWLNEFDPHDKYAHSEEKGRQPAKPAATPAAEPAPDRDTTPTYPLGDRHLKAEAWLDVAGKQARTLDGGLPGWWDGLKAVRARMYRERPDLQPLMVALKQEVEGRIREMGKPAVAGADALRAG